MLASLLSRVAFVAAAVSLFSPVGAQSACNTFALQANSADASINGTYGYIFAGFEDHWVQFGDATYTVANATQFLLSGTNLTTTTGLWMSFIYGYPGESIAYFDDLARVKEHGGQVEPGVCAVGTDLTLECATSATFEWEICADELALTSAVGTGDSLGCTAVELHVVCL